MPKSAIAMKNELRALAPRFSPSNVYIIDLDEDFFDEEEKENMLDRYML